MNKYWDTGYYSQPTTGELRKKSEASRKKKQKKEMF